MAQQKKSFVRLNSSERSIGFKRNGEDVLKVYKGVFQQENSTLRSDSAYFYPQRNVCDAFGHVNISQGDTLNIYSDKLNYNGNTHIAILTYNVRMVDKDATLTTNYLTYNTQTRMGTYTGGGKLVNKDNTLVSKNGYYYAFTRDSYFRYDVVLTTVDALIKTDTLRYNTGSRISYFYGPTNIYGKKDKDTLYTENGLYNTITEQAFFGQKNLYKQGTKSLKGDSLFYDRKKGYGRAVRHIVFNDSEQKITLHGQLGTYTKADERTVVTIDPWVTMVTEQKDTTKKDSVVKGKDVFVKNDKSIKPPPPHTQPVKSQSTSSRNPEVKGKDNIFVKADENIKTPPPHTQPVKEQGAGPKDSTKTTSGVKGKDIFVKNDKNVEAPPPHNAPVKKPGADTVAKGLKKADAGKKTANKGAVKTEAKELLKPTGKDTSGIKRDTIYMVGDTLETRMLTYKELKTLQEERRKAAIRDTTVKAKKPAAPANAKPSKFLTATIPVIHMPPPAAAKNYFGEAKKPQPVAVKKAPQRKMTHADSVRAARVDSVNLVAKVKLSDTSRVRILSAFHHAKIFKSDLQAKSDSIFYSSADSTIRLFVAPIIWTQGSQFSGDTVYLQLKNQKLDNMEMFYHSFIVNVEKGDSTHFNQLGGKKMRGFFADNKLYRMFVDGNAESIYFVRDSGKITEMERSLSTRIRINFKNNEVQNITCLIKPDQTYTPIVKVKDDDKILKGFIWNPKERPVSKESIIPDFNKDRQKTKALAGKTAPPKKPGPGKPGSRPPVKDAKSAGVDALLKGIQQVSPALSDSLGKAVQKINPAVKDSLSKAAQKLTPAQKDSAAKAAQKILPAVRDSLKKVKP